MVELKPRRDRQAYEFLCYLDSLIAQLEAKHDSLNATWVDMGQALDAAAYDLQQVKEERARIGLLLAAPRIVTVGATNGGENNG